jgi:hypothetical protein
MEIYVHVHSVLRRHVRIAHFGREKMKIVAVGWETGSPSLRVENKFNISLRDNDVPRNILRHEALTKLINMTYSLKRLILNKN